MSAELSEENLINDDDQEEDDIKDSVTPQEVVNKIVKGGEEIIIQWHNTILKEPPKFDAFLEQTNKLKNRYPNVILYDRSRVKLIGDKLGDDYYHASYVDSYHRSDGYILAQAPFDEITESDFWRMITQTGTKLIILLTDVNDHEGNRLIKHFWPELSANNRIYIKANIEVNCIQEEISDLYNWYKFSTRNIADKSIETNQVAMIHYRKWIDDKIIPDNLLEFRSEVGLLETASIVRKQRYGCMSYYSHYNHVVDLVVRHAVAIGAVNIGRMIQKE